MAIDLARRHLLVGELGNDTVDVVDLTAGRVVHRITGLKEPQGVAFVPLADLVAVANAGDGSVAFFRAADFAPAGKIDLGNDADNIRLDRQTGRVVVGYGAGGLAVIDPGTRSKLANIRLAAHPEGFRLTRDGGRAFVNVPDARQIAVVDMPAGRQVTTWSVPDLRSNFPMAIDGSETTLAIVFRSPARLVLLDTANGAVRADLDACNDADDVFFDDWRRRVYVSCGEGAVDVFGSSDDKMRRVARIETMSGARTALFVPELDRLFVASRAGWLGGEAKILVFRPVP
jgi:DNA-binding beta-propeller fold protein YncE